MHLYNLPKLRISKRVRDALSTQRKTRNLLRA